MGEPIKIQAIVLNKVDFKDNDRVLTLFSPQLGKVTASAKGVKKQSSKLRASSEIFAFGTYILTETRGKYIVTSFDLIESFYELREDFDRLSVGTLLLKMCEKAVQQNEPNGEMFVLLINCLDRLRDKNIAVGLTVAVFMLKFCTLFGYMPEFEKCIGCGKREGLICLSPQAGGVTCADCNDFDHIVVSGGCLFYMRKICSGQLDEVFKIKPSQVQARELFRVTCFYTAYFFDEKIRLMDYIEKYQLI